MIICDKCKAELFGTRVTYLGVYHFCKGCYAGFKKKIDKLRDELKKKPKSKKKGGLK